MFPKYEMTTVNSAQRPLVAVSTILYLKRARRGIIANFDFTFCLPWANQYSCPFAVAHALCS